MTHNGRSHSAEDAEADSAYDEHRRRQQSQCESEWKRWFASLPPTTQEQMRRKGIDKPAKDEPRRQCSQDEQEVREAGFVDAVLPGDGRAEEEAMFTLADVSECLYFVLSELKSAKRMGMVLDCLCLSVGLGAHYGENGEKIAGKHGVSRQRINTIKDGYRVRMGLIGDAYAKKESARATYRLTNHRKKKCLN